ncbi:toxin-antitoxin system HicB family antitoxin [Cyanobacterium aponinum FACHB-4101]|uniref:toxin-antitoxin system HicB family antitoxin n=1 Tax=Cyanobacterium aponinum TaxID=379064 RepID=UPI001681BB24|nr:toxin-antitoxin system HicB family antitoxin [Cyanobacterium aponinum]MBD2395459.1 toxin-antitoxin system HicB family antitoxin [Cyanobacterium aponinum FACHB-4101]
MTENKFQKSSNNYKKPVKSMRGVPESYDECKKIFSICLTPTAHQQLKNLAKEKHLSLSEFIEQIARKKIPVDIQ